MTLKRSAERWESSGRHRFREMVSSSLSRDGFIIAIDIFKKYPDIKQVTLDTMTDEERKLIEVATKKGGSS